MHGQRFCWCVIAALAISSLPGVAQDIDQRQLERIEQTLRQEGQAVIALADAAEAGHAHAADFAIDWHHDFFKAQAGTFVPFIVSLPGRELRVPAVLLYVRLTRLGAATARYAGRDGRPDRNHGPAYDVEEIYPVDVPDASGTVRISRGVSAQPGDYDLTVVVRERERPEVRGRRRAAVLQRLLHVPDFGGGQLTTSTIILADRLTPLPAAPPPAALLARPYVIGTHEVARRLDPVFGRGEELIVVFLVYHPAVTRDKHFDLEVEYHFFEAAGAAGRGDDLAPGDPLPAAQPGERYVNRTAPQRFNPLVLDPQFEPSTGQPLLAGQRVPLAEFAAGDYRLAITVTDLVAGRTIARQVYFSVRP